jgi:RNA polymerase sigma-70 factor (ECF subfamily)
VVTISESKMQNRRLPQHISALAAEAKTNPAAFSGLYEYYVQPVYRYLYSRVGSAHEAEDLTSQTFIAAYEALPRYRERGHFSSWLFRIAQSKLMDYFRAGKIRLDDVENIQSLSDGADALEDLIEDEELRRIRFLVQHLDEGEQDLLRLRFVAGLTFAEMAEILGKREDGVRKSVNRLLARLKSQME